MTRKKPELCRLGQGTNAIQSMDLAANQMEDRLRPWHKSTLQGWAKSKFEDIPSGETELLSIFAVGVDMRMRWFSVFLRLACVQLLEEQPWRRSDRPVLPHVHRINLRARGSLSSWSNPHAVHASHGRNCATCFPNGKMSRVLSLPIWLWLK